MGATTRRFSFRSHASLAFLLTLLALTTHAGAEPKDDAATKLGKEAMDGDYFAMRFKQAEQKLKKALAMCGKKACIAVVKARLHADLAVVYIAGLKKPDKGKQQIELALDADAAIQLNPDFATPEAEQIYTDAGGIKQEPEVEEEDDGDAAEDEAARQAAVEAAMPRNWVSLGFQQEIVLHESRSSVCSSAEYECFVGNASYPSAIAPGTGNTLDTGVGLGTRRVLLGYERLLFGRLTLGGRVGFAFGGRPNATIGVSPGFNPLHAEVRASYWFGQPPPFQRKGPRFFAGLSGGLGEVNDSAPVILTSAAGQSRQVDAWRKTGMLFLGPHGGVSYAVMQKHALALELRVLRLFGPGAFVSAANLSYALGF
ncbi:MAG TPA: hypothetical protein VEX18_21575 [Polyangiaceae bacterium]|nr:hypothetical protein [Polyangiaceae bacterium]